MGLAAPGNVLHWLSMHLCLVSQCQPCHTYWHQSSRIRLCLSMPSLLSNAWKFAINLLQDVARCTWPYHLSYRQQMTDVISSMPNFCSRDAEGVSSLSLMPPMQRIMAWSLRQSHCSSGLIVSLSWSITERTQRCLVVRTGKSFLNFPHATQWQQWHCHSSHQSMVYQLGSRKWFPHQSWCRRHPFQSQFCHRWAKPCHYTWGRHSLDQPPISSDATALLVDPHHALEHRMEFLPTSLH